MWACLQCFMFMNTHTHTANATIHYKEIPWTSTMNMSIFICFPAFGCLRENELSWRFFLCDAVHSDLSLYCVWGDAKNRKRMKTTHTRTECRMSCTSHSIYTRTISFPFQFYSLFASHPIRKESFSRIISIDENIYWHLMMTTIWQATSETKLFRYANLIILFSKIPLHYSTWCV